MRLKGRWMSSALRLAPEKASYKSAFSPGCPPVSKLLLHPVRKGLDARSEHELKQALHDFACYKQDKENLWAHTEY